MRYKSDAQGHSKTQTDSHPYIWWTGIAFILFKKIPHQCIIKGDGKYQNIAAASILAKTYRDDLMLALDKKHPKYDWKNNKGYPTKKHQRSNSSERNNLTSQKNF